MKINGENREEANIYLRKRKTSSLSWPEIIIKFFFSSFQRIWLPQSSAFLGLQCYFFFYRLAGFFFLISKWLLQRPALVSINGSVPSSLSPSRASSSALLTRRARLLLYRATAPLLHGQRVLVILKLSKLTAHFHSGLCVSLTCSFPFIAPPKGGDEKNAK